MVGDNVAGRLTGNHRLFDYVDKVLPLVPVAEQRHQLSRFPVLYGVGIEVFDRVKIRSRHCIFFFAYSFRTECLSYLLAEFRFMQEMHRCPAPTDLRERN